MVLRALVVLALILGGPAPVGAVMAYHVPDSAGHAGEHGSDPGSHHAAGHGMPEGHSGDSPFDCCSEPGCDCGCAVPQAFSLPVVMAPAAWVHARMTFTRPGTFHFPRYVSAPFRPPA